MSNYEKAIDYLEGHCDGVRHALDLYVFGLAKEIRVLLEKSELRLKELKEKNSQANQQLPGDML